MSSSADNPFAGVKVLALDVLGTVMDWRSTVVAELTENAAVKAASASTPPNLRAHLANLTQADWARFAQDWRTSYFHFCHSFDPGISVWKSVDDHHRESLVELLRASRLEGLYTDAELTSLSRVWHRLKPWPDAVPGLAALRNQGYGTAMFSNGNIAILEDLNRAGGLGFETVVSAEHLAAYKPDPRAYEGALAKLGLRGEQVALVAAHLFDLDSARETGMRTVFVERPEEEVWRHDEARCAEAKEWADLWVSEEGGFLALAETLSKLNEG